MTTETMRLLREVAAEIADGLGETEEQPRGAIFRVVRTLGEERTRALVARALEVEDAGGLLLPNGSRRRTLGGVFFVLARAVLTDAVGKKKMFSVLQGGPKRAVATDTPAGPAFEWAEFPVLAAEAGRERGEATSVKLTIIGRPGKAVERGDVVFVSLRSEKAPSLPKGVPAPTSPVTDYTVLVGRKQWSKVAQALGADLSDKVVIEGYPTVRPDFPGITVHATSATTTGIQAGKRTAQQEATRAEA